MFSRTCFHQTFSIDMPDVTESYGMSLDFVAFYKNFIHNCRGFMSKVLHLLQTFTDSVSNQCTYWGMPKCQM